MLGTMNVLLALVLTRFKLTVRTFAEHKGSIPAFLALLGTNCPVFFLNAFPLGTNVVGAE